jgi:hypothetical protein
MKFMPKGEEVNDNVSNQADVAQPLPGTSLAASETKNKISLISS